MKIYNNNPAFGDCGPFDIDAPTFRLACFELANEMQSSFKMWAREHLDATEGPLPVTPAQYICADIARMRREFLKGLTEVTE
jgi:hypothetical protein